MDTKQAKTRNAIVFNKLIFNAEFEYCFHNIAANFSRFTHLLFVFKSCSFCSFFFHCNFADKVSISKTIKSGLKQER